MIVAGYSWLLPTKTLPMNHSFFDIMIPKKTIEVVAAVIFCDGRLFATQRGYGEWKDWWEFPGGKIEQGEKAEEALKREIREELATEIAVGRLLTTVCHDYPQFHLIMYCYICTVVSGRLSLLEHEDARWLSPDELSSVKWLPADAEVVELLKATDFHSHPTLWHGIL